MGEDIDWASVFAAIDNSAGVGEGGAVAPGRGEGKRLQGGGDVSAAGSHQHQQQHQQQQQFQPPPTTAPTPTPTGVTYEHGKGRSKLGSTAEASVDPWRREQLGVEWMARPPRAVTVAFPDAYTPEPNAHG
jgi:hypothetical protein